MLDKPLLFFCLVVMSPPTDDRLAGSPVQVKVNTDPAGGSCSGPSSRRRNIPPELEEKALQGTESNRRTELGHPAPWTSSGDSSEDQRRAVR